MPWRIVETSVLDEVAARIDGAQERVLLSSPFIGRTVGCLLAARIALALQRTAGALDQRLLTAFSDEAFRSGVLSARALESLLDSGTELRTIPNLHAKVMVIDDWALVGSGNLSQSGLDSLNVELGLSAKGPDAAAVTGAFDTWWRHSLRSAASRITRQDVKRAKKLEAAGEPAHRRQGSAQIRGTPLRNPISVRLREQLLNERRTQVIAALRADLSRAVRPPQASESRRMTDSRAYRDVESLWLDESDPDRHAIRTLLLEVLRRHPDESARAHAAWRLARDGWSDTGPTKRVLLAVNRARRRDPAFVVRRNAARALSRNGR